MDCNAMADRYVAECRKQGITLMEALARADMPWDNISNIRRGKRGPSADTILRLCRGVGRDPNWLLGWEDRNHDRL